MKIKHIGELPSIVLHRTKWLHDNTDIWYNCLFYLKLGVTSKTAKSQNMTLEIKVKKIYDLAEVRWRNLNCRLVNVRQNIFSKISILKKWKSWIATIWPWKLKSIKCTNWLNIGLQTAFVNMHSGLICLPNMGLDQHVCSRWISWRANERTDAGPDCVITNAGQPH